MDLESNSGGIVVYEDNNYEYSMYNDWIYKIKTDKKNELFLRVIHRSPNSRDDNNKQLKVFNSPTQFSIQYLNCMIKERIHFHLLYNVSVPERAAPRFWRWGDNFASEASEKIFLTPSHYSYVGVHQIVL